MIVQSIWRQIIMLKKNKYFVTQNKKGHVGSERYPKDSK